MKRSKGTPIIGCVTTEIPTWGYHQLIFLPPSRLPIMVPSGGNEERPLDLVEPKWTINLREIKEVLEKDFKHHLS